MRAAPYTLSARFGSWATTDESAAAAIGAAESLARWKGLQNDFAKPYVNGVSVTVGPNQGTHHKTRLERPSGSKRA